jgi:hypothetical protein
MLEGARQGRDARRVGGAGNLAKDSLLAVGLEPVGGGLDALDADVAADALILGSGAVGVCGKWSACTSCLPSRA